MTDNLWTKGPWVPMETHGAYAIMVGKYPRVAYVHNNEGHESEALANAHLIASAPELFRSAEILASLDEGEKRGRRFPTADECQIARDAVAKARGEKA